MSTAIILSGGDGAPTVPLPRADLVVAADSGLALAERLALTVDVVIGDMDSVDHDLLAVAADSGVEIQRHPTDKDSSDLDLALDLAVERGATRLVVAGGGGGRLDHLLANAALITADRHRATAIEWWVGHDVATVVRSTHALAGVPGDLVTLLAINTPTTVTTTGLRWELDRGRLEPGSTRGLSNELEADAATITVHSGTLLMVHRRGR